MSVIASRQVPHKHSRREQASCPPYQLYTSRLIYRHRNTASSIRSDLAKRRRSRRRGRQASCKKRPTSPSVWRWAVAPSGPLPQPGLPAPTKPAGQCAVAIHLGQVDHAPPFGIPPVHSMHQVQLIHKPADDAAMTLPGSLVERGMAALVHRVKGKT